MLMYLVHRGTTFRQTYLDIGNIRSLLPEKVRVMALTATATVVTRNAVCRIIGMTSPSIISEIPNRPNIKYIVNSGSKNIEETFAPLVEEVKLKRASMDRVIVYCRTYDSCASIFLYFKSRLKGEMREPIGVRDLAVFRLVDMFNGRTRDNVKDVELESFCNPTGCLRIIIATVAFGLGLDCPNVRRIIHWGPSNDIEQYMQETGRAGRDSLPAVAVLHTVDLAAHEVEESMKQYYKNKVKCRRKLLLSPFEDFSSNEDYCETFCKCCDVCESVCTCMPCIENIVW